MNLKSKVLERLKKVIDPGTLSDVFSMGLIKDLTVDDKMGKIDLKFRPSSFTCPLAFKICLDIKEKLFKISGVKKVNVEVIDFNDSENLNNILRQE